MPSPSQDSEKLTDADYEAIGEAWTKAQRLGKTHLHAFLAGVRAAQVSRHRTPSVPGWQLVPCKGARVAWPAFMNDMATAFFKAHDAASKAHGFYESFYAGWNAALVVAKGHAPEGVTYIDPDMEHRAEDADALHLNLDKAGVPRVDTGGEKFSLWGRVCAYRNSTAALAREEAARMLEDLADKIEPPGKRTPVVDRHTAGILRTQAAAIRAIGKEG